MSKNKKSYRDNYYNSLTRVTNLINRHNLSRDELNSLIDDLDEIEINLDFDLAKMKKDLYKLMDNKELLDVMLDIRRKLHEILNNGDRFIYKENYPQLKNINKYIDNIDDYYILLENIIARFHVLNYDLTLLSKYENIGGGAQNKSDIMNKSRGELILKIKSEIANIESNADNGIKKYNYLIIHSYTDYKNDLFVDTHLMTKYTLILFVILIIVVAIISGGFAKINNSINNIIKKRDALASAERNPIIGLEIQPSTNMGRLISGL